MRGKKKKDPEWDKWNVTICIKGSEEKGEGERKWEGRDEDKN